MKLQERRAISPIIATLLLIAIAVGAGIIVYVFVTGLAGTLTGSGGQQVTQQLQLQAYTFNPIPGGSTGTGQVVNFFLKNVGSSSLTIANVYFDGTQLVEWGAGTYTANLMVPNGAANPSCFAMTPTGTTILASTSATPTTGTAALCTGSSTCTVLSFCLVLSANTETSTLAAQTANQLFVGLSTVQTAGSSHTLKIVTSTGGQYVFSVIAGRTG